MDELVKVFDLETIAYIIGWLEILILVILIITSTVLLIFYTDDDDWKIGHIVIICICVALLIATILLMIGVLNGRETRCMMCPWLILHAILLLPFILVGKCLRIC